MGGRVAQRGMVMVGICLLGMSAPAGAQEADATATAVKTAPALLSEPDLSIPQDALLAGHHGTVVLRGTVGLDGVFSNIAVRESSRSEILDKAAIAEASNWRFSPALDAEGKPVAWTGNVPIGYDVSSGGGLWTYSCEPLVRDSDWSDATFGKEFRAKRRSYLLLSGMMFAAEYRAGAKKFSPFETRWQATIDGCRARPKSKFMDVFRRQQ